MPQVERVVVDFLESEVASSSQVVVAGTTNALGKLADWPLLFSESHDARQALL